MTTFTLDLRMKTEEGALTRLFGLITRRSYVVESASVKLVPEGGAWDISLELRSRYPKGEAGYRPAEVIAKMAAKLHEVEKVELRPKEA